MDLPYVRPNQNTVQRMAHEQQQRHDRSQDFEDIEFIELKSGRNVIRVMPPFNDQGDFGIIERNHWDIPGVVNKSGKNRPIKCLEMWHKQLQIPCPICKILEEVKKLVTDPFREGRLDIRGRMNVIDRMAQAAENKTVVGILRLPITVYNQIGANLADPAYFDALHPVMGTDIEIERVGKGLDTKYTVIFQRAPSPDPNTVVAYKSDLLRVPYSGQQQQHNIAEIQKVMEQSYDLNRIFRPPYDTEMEEFWAVAMRLRETLCNKFQIGVHQIPEIPYPFSGGRIPETVPKDTRKKRDDNGGRMEPPPPRTNAPSPPPQAMNPIYPNGYPPPPVNPAPPAPVPSVSMSFPSPTNPYNPPPAQAAPVAMPAPPPVAPVQAPPVTPAPNPSMNVNYPTPTAPNEVTMSPEAAAAKRSIEASSHFQNQKPACYAGASPHQDGRYGYQEDLDHCNICPHEPECRADFVSRS